MFSLADIYRPITAAPFRNNILYKEIPPCKLLSPYIRCYWGTDTIIDKTFSCNNVVIPDTCMDIIFTINYKNNITSSTFCTIDQTSHSESVTLSNPETANFGIRFYPWSAILFSNEDFTVIKNQRINANLFFNHITQELESKLWNAHNISERVKITEYVLLTHLSEKRLNAALMNSLYYSLTGFSVRVSDVCNYASISPRQLERIYKKNFGISPKTFLELIRYQRLWQNLIFDNNINILDAVDKFGYYDQAHLLNDFKKYHQMTPNEAVKYALANR